MAVGRGCSSCPGPLLKNVLGCDAGAALRRAQTVSGWLTIFGCSPQALLPQSQSSEAASFSFLNGWGIRMPWISIPSELVPSSSTTPRDIFPSQAHSGCFLCFCLIFSPPLGAGTSCRWQMGAAMAAGWRKREGRHWDHATSCSRRLLQTFLQHIQPHGTFCVTKASKNINHQN